jgi:glycosyltransferase involved in cell wall biosynthesis
VRVALVTYALQVGGVETFLRHLADFFRERGDEVDLVETQAEGRWSRAFAAGGYAVRQVLPRRSRSRLHHVRRIAAALAGYEALVLNDAPWAQAGLGLLPARTAVVPVLHLALPTMVRNAAGNPGEWDRMVAVSPATRRAALDAGVPEERVVCIPNGVPVPAAWPKGGAAGRGAGLRAVFVGALHESQKGVLLLPEILRRAAAAGVPLRLDVVGDGPDRAALAAAFAEAGLGAAATLHGALPHDRALEIMAGADLLLMPSRFEGLPLVLLEAMAAGVVPIVSRLPESTDFVVAEGASGLLAPPGDAAGFAAAAVGLGRDRARLSALSRGAWETARDRFSKRGMGEAYAALFGGILGGVRARVRSGAVDRSLLGDWPGVPLGLVRPARTAARVLGVR